MLERGETPEQFNYVAETLFSSLTDITSITVGTETYAVEIEK